MAVNKNPISIKELAKIAGVNVSTISRSLNGTGRISDETRDKIKKLAEKHGYLKNLAAYNLKTRASMSLALVFHDFNIIQSNYYSMLLKGIDNVIGKTQYSTMISNQEHIDRFENMVGEGRLDGAFIIGDHNEDKDFESFRKYNIPIVIVNQDPGKYSRYFDCVYKDNVEMTRELTLRAVEKGYKDIMYLHGGNQYLSSAQRLEGFRKAAGETGIRSLVLNGNLRYEYESGYSLLKDYLAGNEFDYSCLIGANDNMVMGAVKALYESGFDMDKVLAIGHDRNQASRYFIIPVHSVDTMPVETGEKAAQLMLDRINGTLKEYQSHIIRPDIDKYIDF